MAMQGQLKDLMDKFTFSKNDLGSQNTESPPESPAYQKVQTMGSCAGPSASDPYAGKSIDDLRKRKTELEQKYGGRDDIDWNDSTVKAEYDEYQKLWNRINEMIVEQKQSEEAAKKQAELEAQMQATKSGATKGQGQMQQDAAKQQQAEAEAKAKAERETAEKEAREAWTTDKPEVIERVLKRMQEEWADPAAQATPEGVQARKDYDALLNRLNGMKYGTPQLAPGGRNF